jgi:hypothetical protein
MQVVKLLTVPTLPPSRGHNLVLDETPETHPDEVLVAVFPQDPLVDRDQPLLVSIPRAEMELADGARLQNRWFTTVNSRSPRRLEPDENGNFLYAPGTTEFAHVNAHVHATKTVQMVERLRGKPIPWKFGNPNRQRVAVHVNSGRSGSSHTNFGPRNIKLDTYTSPSLGKEVKDAECAEAIAHEVGHDILQGLRPQHAEGDLETGAFAEAFGDSVAILYTMEFDRNRERALSQTSGNLRHQNLISKLFEEDGKAQRLKANPEARSGFWLRSAINDKQYQKPEDVKDYEEHRESLPYTAAFCGTLAATYERNGHRSAPHDRALERARHAGQGVGQEPRLLAEEEHPLCGRPQSHAQSGQGAGSRPDAAPPRVIPRARNSARLTRPVDGIPAPPWTRLLAAGTHQAGSLAKNSAAVLNFGTTPPPDVTACTPASPFPVFSANSTMSVRQLPVAEACMLLRRPL